MKRMVYVPSPRGWLLRFVDLAFVVAVLAFVYTRAWHWQLDCAWQGNRASCTRVADDSLGRRLVQHVEGIRGLAFHRDTRVGFVTDATHADNVSLFGMNEVALLDAAQADEVARFADDRLPRSVSYQEGFAHPVLISVFGLFAIFAWALFTRERRWFVTVDAKERMVTVSGGFLRGVERFEIAATKFQLERSGARARVKVKSKDTELALGDGYRDGPHHEAFVGAVTAAMAKAG